MLPLISWDGEENLQGHIRSLAVEERLGDRALTFSSCQTAIMSCLEVLGSRLAPITVIMPVTAPVDALMGVIKAGGNPILLDINQVSLQMDVNQLTEILQDLDEYEKDQEVKRSVVVYLNRPGGMSLDTCLVDCLQDYITVVDTRLPPCESYATGTFSIYDLSVLSGQGAVVFHNTDQVFEDLKVVREENHFELPEVLSALVYKRLPELKNTVPTDREYVENIKKYDIIGFSSISNSPFFWVYVKNAKNILEKMKEKGVDVRLGLVPLYKYVNVKKRLNKDPAYPVAERLHNHILVLPNNQKINKRGILEDIHGYEKEESGD